MSQKTPLRWLRFSLKSLFLLVLVVAAYFGGWRSALWTAEREKEEAVRKAVEQLQASRDAESRVRVSVASGIVLGNFDAHGLEDLLDLQKELEPRHVPAVDEARPTRTPQEQP